MMTIEQAKQVAVGARLVYNDGRNGHQGVMAEVLEASKDHLVAQFEDRYTTTVITFVPEWLDHLTSETEAEAIAECVSEQELAEEREALSPEELAVLRVLKAGPAAENRTRIGNTPTCDECGQQHNEEQDCEVL